MVKLSLKKVFKDETSLSFFKHFSKYLSGELFNKFLGLLTIAILTRLLPVNEYGKVSIFMSVFTIFSIIISLNLRSAISRFYYEKEIDYYSFLDSIISFLIVFIPITIFVFYFGFASFFKIYLNIDNNIYLWGLVTAGFASFFQLYLSYLMGKKESTSYNKLYILQNLIGLILFLILIYTIFKGENRYMARILGISFTYFFLAFYSLIKIKPKFKIKLNYLKEALSFSVPLIPHSLSTLIIAQADKIMLNKFVGLTSTGLYTFGYQISAVIHTIILAMTKIWTPFLYSSLSEKKYEDIDKIINKLSISIYSIVFIFLIFTPEIVSIFAPKSYYNSIYIIPILINSYVFIFLYTFYGGFSFYYKKTNWYAFFTIVTATINILVNLILIPKYSYIGAAISSLISYFFLFLFNYLLIVVFANFEYTVPLRKLMKHIYIVILGNILFYIFFKLSNEINWYYTLTLKLILGLILGSIIFKLIILPKIKGYK